MAASLLQENLRSLHDSLTSQDTFAKEQSDSCISDIRQICVYEAKEYEFDLYCSVLFDKDTGVIIYLKKLIGKDEFQTSKQKILEFLSEFIQKVEKKISHYALEIKDVCMSLFMREKGAKIRSAAISVLVKLLELTAGTSVGKDFEVKKMAEKIFMEFAKPLSKTPATVKEKLYIVLGVMAEIYPEYMTEYADRLTGQCVAALKEQMTSKTKKAELTIISGCLEGLRACLVNFTQSADEGSKYSYDIFKYTRMAISNMEIARYDVPKAGLRMIAKHAAQFNMYLFDDYQEMYEKLRFWSKHHNREMLHEGMAAVESFLKQISESLVEKAKQGKKEGGVFKYFIQQFRGIMNDSSATAKELSLAVRGYGLLAAPCKTFLKPADVQFMFSEMITKSQQQYLVINTEIEDKLYNLPSYLESLANIIFQLDDITETYATLLERLMIVMMENVPVVHHTMRFIAIRSMLWLLLSVMSKGATFQKISSTVVFQGLIRTCSHPPIVDLEQSDEDKPETGVRSITYKDYIEIWTGLFSSPKIKDFAQADISIDQRHRLTEILYDELIQAILKIIDKLDLTSNTSTQISALTGNSDDDDTNEASADPIHGVQANRPKDFQILINLVDFCRELLPQYNYNLFEKWMFTFCHTIVLKSTENSLVSGFYKLIAVAMKIANKIKFFEDIVKDPDNSMEVDEGIVTSQQTHPCFLLVSKFSKEVLVRMKQYRDDLLASCLTMILALPKEIITEEMSEVVPAIQATLTIGLSYLPLSMVALDALEYWSATLPPSILSPHYHKILPYLDSYLRTADQGSDEGSADSVLNLTAKKPNSKRKKMTVRLVTQRKSNEESYQSGLSQVKYRIIKYLGSLGGCVNYNLLATAQEDITEQAISWDTHKHLKFDMPFMDMKPTIYLDSFLPRIVELATTSSDRQTKVAACELLHSLVLFCLGRGASQLGRGQERFSMAPLYKKMFPSLLQLACDVEQVAKQLFEPLIMQIIHWFTNNKKAESEETMTLLDSIYDGIIQSTDTSLRDFCAVCLKEFVKWSIKQTPPKVLEKSPLNIKSVLKRLYSYSLHPGAFKRLGASLAFNSIYTIFREEASLVDLFAFDILVHFVESLAIAHTDDKSLGTQEQCKKTLEHLERIITVKADILRKENPKRKEPKAWSTPKLDIGVRWLLRRCGAPHTECRHMCMKLVHQLCPLVEGIKSPIHYFQTFLKHKKQVYFINMFEGGGNPDPKRTPLCLLQSPTMLAYDTKFSVDNAVQWFDIFLAPLDCYVWLFGEKLLTPTEIFSGDGIAMSKVLKTIQYFVENIALTDIRDLSRQFDIFEEFYTPKEIDVFNRSKCTVLVRILNLLTVMIANFQKETFKVAPKELWSNSLWTMICTCVIQPSGLGFNLGDVEIMKNLPNETEQLLVVMSRFLPKDVITNIQKGFKQVLHGDKDLSSVLPVSLTSPEIDLFNFEQLLRGYGQLFKTSMLPDSSSSPVNMAKQLFNNVYKGMTVEKDGILSAVSLTPAVKSACNIILELSFLLGLPTQILTDAILDTTLVSGSSKGLQHFYGDLIFSTFKSTICTQIAKESKNFCPLLAQKAESNSRRVSSVLVSVIDHVTRDKQLRKSESAAIVNSVLEQWGKLSSWWGDKASLDLQSMALLVLSKLILIDSKIASSPAHQAFDQVFMMYQTLLTNKANLDFKCRVLELLAFFALLPNPHEKKLKASLDRLIADNFPLKSTEFEKESPEYQTYTSTLDRILSSLELSGSLMLLEVIISIFCREKVHVYEDKIVASLSKFIKRLPGDKQKSALDVPYKIFCEEGRYPGEIRRATVDKVLVTMLRLVQLSTLSQFFVANMEKLRSIVEAKPKSKDMDGWLISRLCCFEMFEVLYSRMSKDQVFNKTSEINRTFCQVKDAKVDTGKEMTQIVMRCAHDAKSEDMTGEATLLDLRREYHCAAYNLLISVVSCTQTDAKFYAVFLFGENEAKRQFLYDNLLDKDKEYNFPIEVKAPYERKKKFVSIRNEVKEKRERDGDEEDMEYSSSFNLASMYLGDSSLHEDINQYDFSASGASQFLADKDKNRKPALVKKSSTEPDDDQEDKGVIVEEDYVELDMDELNQHECMAPSIALLKHMQQSSIIPKVEVGVVPELPQWMKNMMEKLKNTRTTRNVKLYLTKLIINTSSIFKPFARHWLRPLCQLLLGGTYGDSGINVFLVDVMVTMLSWNKVAIPQDTPEEKAMASRVVDFLMKNVYHETKQVFKSNLDLLKTTLQCWKDRVEIPYNSVYELLKGGDNDGRGIQVLGVVLSCQLPPYGPTAPVDRERFFGVVTHQMTNHYKIVYSAAAEVVGLILKYLAEKERETEGFLHDHATKTLLSIQVAKPDNFIICVHKMHKHYVSIADRFTNRLLFMMPNLRGEFRTLCLDVLLSRIDTISDVFIELKSKGLLSYLTHRDENTQLTAMKIVKAIMVKLKPVEMNQIYSAITAFASHPSASCRNIMYDIMMWVCDNYREEDDVDAIEILRQTKDGLLRGLGDEDLQCRLLVQNFWSSETRLPGHTVDRLVAMFEAMYSPSTEQYFLSYATNLVLEMTSKSPDYQREIFELPLEDCKFQDLSVKSSWRHRHAAMTPLFATTLATQTDMEEGESMSVNVRATQQDVQFSATQDASRAPFNWLTQSSLDTFTDFSSVGTETSSSLMFTVGTADMAARASIHRPSLKPRSGFGKSRPGAQVKKQEKANEEDDADKSEFFRLKRRFKRDDEKTRVYFAKKNIRVQQMREMVKAEQKSKRESQVTMYRKYRIGDLPDIQIKYSYIIAPLQAIAHRDSTVAKLLFSEVFKAIFNKMDEVKPEREIQESIKQINSSIDTILSSSTNYFPPFISCVLDILFELRNKLTVDVSNISSCAVISNIQPLGIVVLEDQLIVQGGDEARSSKRGRNDGLTVSRDIATWIELARLYKSVDEFDVLLGIFTNKLGTKEITKKAVEAESRCDYHKARTYYEEALDKDWSGEKPLDAELDLWDDCRMKCLNNLTQWKELQNVTDLAVEEGNIAKVWDDTFYQEHYLPYIMRSKVKLMLQGDEDQQTLLDFVDGAMRNPEQKSLLESRYCEYLALMYAWQQDYDRARHYSKMAQDKFLQEWCSTDVLIVSSRASRLQVLQPLVELQEFLEFMSVESNFNSNVPSTQLLAKWERRNPHVILDSIDTWDDIVTNRNVYLDHISQKLISCKTEDSMETDDGDIFLSSKVKLKLLMAESSTTQNNYKLSLNILAETRRQCKELDDINMLLWSHLYTLTHQKKAQNTEWSDDVFNSILSTGDLLGKYEKSGLLKEHAGLGRRHFVLTGQSHKLLASAVSNLKDLRDLNDKNQHKLKELTGKSKPSEITEVLVHNGYEQIKKSLSFDGTSTLDCSYGMDQAYLMTAKYCDTFLRLEEDDEMSLSGTDTDTFTSTVIVCLLNAMKLDCKEARQRFPRLLQLVEMNPNTVEKFKEKCAELPCWMFIMWIGQMVALLDKPEAKAIHNIIIDIAKTYPQAVTYPFKLSGEGYTFGNTSEDKENKAVKQKIEELLNDSLVSKFVSALEQFSQPDQLFKDWSEDIKLLIKKKEKDKIKAEFAKMYKLIFDHSMTSSARQSVDSSQGLSQVSQASIVETGNYIKKFGAKFKKDVEKVFGKDGQKIGSMSLKEFQINFSKLYTEMDEEVKGINKKKELIPPRSLVDYCEWMADFSGSTQGRRLEIPGQYNGESKPMPEYHVKVVGFDPRILVMSSIRKPKRLTIRGNDEKDYNYLVKGGEDLRQDQRIEQLFHLMNQVFVNNPACRHRKLHVKTYQVIPMTSRVGLIEWVKNTIPLKEFLRGSLTERENIDDRKTGPLILHVDWLKKLTKDNQIVQYCQMYLRYNKTETIREFKNKESRIPWDLMRRSFRQMSTSPEAFHVLRVNCAVSYAVMSICQYILGIGDRHLSNSMIDLSTGQMVGIDFGHAFGSATQFLPIPELMPFRLTRQIRNLMMPLQEKGLMESTMIHTLRALQEDYDLLLNTMDIFIKEPSLDWQINAEKQKQAMGEDSIEAVEETEEDRSWFSKQKVQYALRKMKGHNPRIITRDELKLGEKRHMHFSKALKAFENVALGDPKDNIRSQLPDKGLSVEQQVAALIDQATDPNILGRTYAGWEPWM
ncbi:DNA-dependent protein kinase catalytic subunit-like [Mytilus galloprovincialis]|uniref:DNA-dependent protein kinase catalytic subunit-like n=1 Tax=Mytilus galloprovincialis TaxID=29158 RepID=UPI003F7C3397